MLKQSPQVNIDFITSENIEMIWEIILDDIKDRIKTQEQQSNARGFFINQARIFFEREKSTQQGLMQMNKQFISQIMKSFNGQGQNQGPSQTPNQNPSQNPSQKQSKPIFKAEDIQAERLNAFERGLEEKKNDFLNAMTIPKPDAPNFSDNTLDAPIGGAMEELIARTLAQRNFEIEVLNKSSNKDDVEKWLKPTETSIKTEKIQQKQQNDVQMDEKQKQYQYKNNPTPRFIQIGDELPINKKQLTWGENKEYEFNEINLEINEIPAYKPNSMREIEENTIINRSPIINAPATKTNDIFSKLKSVKEDAPLSSEIALLNNRISNLENKMEKILELLTNKN
jgi:hypothetical protein